jgi:thioredoxin 2
MSGSRQIVCPACSTINRLPHDRPAKAAKCGKCGIPLFSGTPVEADAAAFERHTQRNDIPVLVDVWAPWCGPCRMMAPAFKGAASELEPGLRLIKLNSEAEPSVAARLGIRGIPTMILFAGGRELGRVSGAMAKEQIVAWAHGQLSARTARM